MPKKQELRKIVRGKGLEALRPTAETFSSTEQTAEAIESDSKIHSSSDNSMGEAAKGSSTAEKQLSKNIVITEILPTPEQQSYIQEMLGVDANQILIWDTFIWQGEKRGSAFKKDTPLTFNICCTASGIMAQFKPEFEIHWISYDILRMQVQSLYNVTAYSKPFWPNFKIQFRLIPAAVGFFNFHVIVDPEVASLFWVRDGFVFKIMDNV